MLYKLALCEVVRMDNPQEISGEMMIKTASGNSVVIESGTDKARIVAEAVKKHPTALFFRAKAIKADETNSNGDHFTSDELKKAYKSFEGVPFFTNHDNQNIENARGKIIFAEWVEDKKNKENAVYVIGFVDREAFPHICRSIEEEYTTGVSMGAAVEYSTCSICGNKAEKTEDYCTHIRNRKGRKFTGRSKNVVTGEVRDFRDAPVFEYNYGVKFIELSAVVDPACPSCHIQGIIPNDDFLKRVANLQNTLFMYKEAAIEKTAGQEEINQLNQVLETLENIAVNLIKNRQQVEVEFASDLVEILSKLQTFVDELVGAGYGNVQQVPGTSDMPSTAPYAQPPMPSTGESLPSDVTESAALPSPVSEEIPVGGAGSISGSPSQPMVKSPQLPITSPIRPKSFSDERVIKVASALNDLGNKLFITGDDMAKRRTLAEKKDQKEKAIKVLSNSWQEKQEFIEYIKKVPSLQSNKNRLSVKKRDDSFIIVAENKDTDDVQVWTYEDLTDEERGLIKESPTDAAMEFLKRFENNKNSQKEGVNRMTHNIKEAGAGSVNKSPDVLQEVQLGAKGIYHPRTEDPKDEITQAQLESQRKGEKDILTEKQLDEKIDLNPRQKDEKEVITQVQLEQSRKNDEKNEVTQAQLDTEGNRVNNEPDVITEKQLDGVSSEWERSASSSVKYKTASEHMASVLGAMADSVIATGCTPSEICKVASAMISTSKGRYELSEKIVEKSSEKDVDYSSRLSFWSGRKVHVASVDVSEIAGVLLNSLRKVASDKSINPDLVIDALDVIVESDIGAEKIVSKVDEKINTAKSIKQNKVSAKDELRKSLIGSESKIDTKAGRDEIRKDLTASVAKDKMTREAERAIWDKAIEKSQKGCDTIIETNFQEVGCKKDSPHFKTALKSFAKGALASQNIKLAAITNVTISGDTIAIAVQTDGEEGVESVNIPIGDKSSPAGASPEGDMTGEGDAALAGAPSLEDEGGIYASSSKKIHKKAQVPMGGGIPGTPGDVAGGPGAPEAGLAGPTPGGEPIGGLTTGDELPAEDFDIPTTGEKQMPYAICPECGSSDVDVASEDTGDITGKCNNCGAEYEALIKKEIEFKLIKPTKSVGEEGAPVPEEPEVPALPVAAQTKLDKNGIVRVASNQEKHGHVCPACGMTQCKASADKGGHTEYVCPACHTEVSKDMMINVNDPSSSYLRVQWDVVPDIENCADCKEDVKKFASMIRIEKMMKKASQTPFPKANCIEYVTRKWGGNSVATFGGCKGKPLADCICNQLEKLGMTKVRHIEKLASVLTKKDPMDECMEEQKSKGFSVKEASTICNCLKKKFASKEDYKILKMAFEDDVMSGKEKDIREEDLDIIDDVAGLPDEVVIDEGSDIDEFDLNDGLPPVDEIEIDVEEAPESDITGGDTVKIEVSEETAKELAGAATDATTVSEETETEEVPSEEITEISVGEESPDTELPNLPKEEIKMELASQKNKLQRVGNKVVKVAKEPKKVEDIEGNVEAGVPRAKATMGKEGPNNIDVKLNKPSVPRGDARMGQEGPDNIDKPAGLPDVAIDSSYMGDEKGVQKNMPEINDEIKGTVIASNKQIKAEKLKEVETVEGDVEAGVPRAKATMGKEGPDNIDVELNKPDVPRADATMGNEGADNIDVKAEGPDVPVDDSYMGGEKEVQKDMPGINKEILKNVQQKRTVQMDRIAQARKMEAVKVASKLLATKRIDEGAYDDVVDALSNFEIDKIASTADKMFPKQIRTASTNVATFATPPVMESKELSSSDPMGEFANKLSRHFTIGNKSFDENLTRYGDK